MEKRNYLSPALIKVNFSAIEVLSSSNNNDLDWDWN